MAGDNPFDAPAAGDMPRATTERGLHEARFTDPMEQFLLRAKPWQMFLGVLGFIGAGLVALAGIFATLGGLLGGVVSGDPGQMMFGVVGFFYLGLAAVTAYPAWCLTSMSSSAGRLVSAYDAEEKELAGEETLRHMQNYFRFNGILTAVGIGLYLFLLVLMCGLGGLGGMISQF